MEIPNRNDGSLSVNGISGTLGSPANLNAGSVMNSSVVFGQSFQLPQAPNPTPFSP